jgi:thymidylate synthase
MNSIRKIRELFSRLFQEKSFVPDKSGQNTIEILGAQFIADDETIFGIPNQKYITKEIGWYMSRSLNINDMENPPKIWKSVASEDGFINSNYGFLVFDSQNYSQIDHCILELKSNPWSRRAVAIYTRPSMWIEYNKKGMSDFICTNTVQYFIRANPVEPDTLRFFARVDMRSNDAWAGYRNDFAWQMFVFNYMYTSLQKTFTNLRRGAIIWCCGSLHLYESNFDLVQHYIDTGEHAPHPEDLVITRNKLVTSGVIRE